MNRGTFAAPSARTFPLPVQPDGERRAFAGFLAQGTILLVIAFLTICTFEGALRFYAARAGLPWIVYVKDVVLIGAIAFGVLHAGVTNLRHAPFLIVAALLAAGTVIGLTNLSDPRQPLFAAKTWLPLLCGTLVGAAVDLDSKLLRWACAVLWACAIGGIILTSQWAAPWVGFVYDVGGVALEGSREWTIGDTARVPGFSRASFDAALQCLFFGAIVVTGLRSYAAGVAVWVISGAAMYFTLSRSALVALVVAVGLHFLTVALKSTQRLAKVAVALLALTVIALPFAAEAYFRNRVVTMEQAGVASTSSFEERAVKTWPDGMALLQRDGHWATGRGLGGIGVAQQVFETDIFSPGDNAFVYLWVALGAAGVAFLLYIALQALRAVVPLTRKRRAGIVLVGAFLSVGLTLNGIEAAIASLFLGVGLSWLADRRREEGQET
jgi:hypothetical protein